MLSNAAIGRVDGSGGRRGVLGAAVRARTALLAGLLVLGAAPLAATSASAQVPLPPFPCDGQFYGMQNNDQLFRIDFATSPFTYTPLGGPTPFNYNALGFNHQDGYLYAITNVDLPHRVVRFGANGAWEDRGPVAALNDANYLAGAFLADGRYVVANGNGATIVVLDVATSPPTVLSVASYAPDARIRDFAVSPVDGVLYGFDAVSQRMARINPATGAVVPFGVARPAGQEIGVMGSAWFDAFGRFYGYSGPPDGTGGQTVFYQADVGAGGPGQLGELVQVSTGPETGGSDGASCPFGVRMEKTVDPGAVQAGDTVTYSYTITNRSAVVQHPRFTDTMDGGRTFVAGTLATTHGGSVNAYGGTNTLDISGLTINTGETATITVQAQVPATAAAGTVFNQATLSGLTSPAPGSLLSDYPGTAGPSDRTPLQVTAAPPPSGADLSVDKSGPAEAAAGDVIQYVIAVSNASSGTATGVSIADILPAGFGFVSASGGAVANGSVVTWSIGSLGPGATVTLTLVVRAPLEAGSGTNSVTVSSDNDPNPANNSDAVTTSIRGGADLSVEKTGPAQAQPNGNVSYTIVVANAGPSTAVGVTVTDTLPAGFAFVAASEGGTQTSPGVVTWSLGNLPVSAVVNRTVVVRAPSEATTGTNVATAASATPDANPANNRAEATTTVVAVADLAVSKTGPEQVLATQNATFTVTVSNLGPSTATGATLTDTLPAGFTFVSASDGGSQTSPGVVTWSVGDVGPGATVTRTVVLRASAQGASATSVATVSSTTDDPNSSNNRAEAAILVVATADASVDKSGPEQLDAGQTATYTITVTNAGPSTAVDVVATDALPPGFTFVSATDGGAAAPSGVVTWIIGTLAPGATVSRSLVVLAPTEGASVVNRASATAATLDPDTANNHDEVNITVVAVADLALDKSGPVEVFATASATYTLAFTNLGPSTATGVAVRETIPTGFTLVSASDGGAETSPGVVTWNVGTLAPSAGGQRTVVLRAPAEESTATDEATLSAATADRDTTNNRDAVTTRVIAVSDVIIDKTGPAEVDAGQLVTYVVTVGNDGPSTAGDVVVSDALPAGVSFVSASDGGTQSPPGTVTWSLGPMSPGATRSVTVTGRAPNEAAMLTNTAHVDTSTFDPDSGNDDDSVSTRVVPIADLAIDKSAPETVEAGESLTYTIAVTNNGPSTAANVVVTDEMPAGFVFVSADNGGAQTGPTTVAWNLGTMAPGLTRTVSLTATAPLRVFTSTNRADVRSDTVDRNPANNTESVDTRVVDTTPPVTACGPTTSPAGKNEPGRNGNGGQNPDGFYILTAVDRVDPSPTVTITDTASGTVFGPFPSGTTIKLTQAPGGKPSQKPGPGVIDWQIHLNGDAAVRGTDFSGNVSDPVFCLVPPNPK